MRNIWVWFFVVIIIILGFVFWISSSSPVSNNSNGSTLVANAIGANDWKEGSTTSPVTLVEFSDFQCPACGAYFPVVEQLNSEYADKFQFVYKNYPLPQHEHALLAAYAAEAAGRQGKFFEMYRLIFSNQNEWTPKNSAEVRTTFEGYAESLGLNMAQFKKDIDSEDVKNKIDHDKIQGNQSGVMGTPTFFLNGKQIQNPQSYDAFKALIDNALNESK